jgi:hypothetical protein
MHPDINFLVSMAPALTKITITILEKEIEDRNNALDLLMECDAYFDNGATPPDDLLLEAMELLKKV